MFCCHGIVFVITGLCCDQPLNSTGELKTLKTFHL
jgi:hypothetical protein